MQRVRRETLETLSTGCTDGGIRRTVSRQSAALSARVNTIRTNEVKQIVWSVHPLSTGRKPEHTEENSQDSRVTALNAKVVKTLISCLRPSGWWTGVLWLSFLLHIVLCESCALSCTFPLNSVVCTPCYLLTFTFYIPSSHPRSSNNGTLACFEKAVETRGQLSGGKSNCRGSVSCMKTHCTSTWLYNLLTVLQNVLQSKLLPFSWYCHYYCITSLIGLLASSSIVAFIYPSV